VTTKYACDMFKDMPSRLCGAPGSEADRQCKQSTGGAYLRA
jgi:hypothetical protein